MTLKIRMRMHMIRGIASMQIRQLLFSADIWIVVFTVIMFCGVLLKMDIGRYEIVKLSMLEVLPNSLANADMMFMVLAAMLFLISDIPGGFQGNEIIILRTDRTAWYAAQWIYAGLVGVVYFVLLNIFQVANYLGVISLSIDIKLQGRLFWTWLSYFALFVLLMMFFAGICIVCNLLGLPSGSGVAINGILIFAQRVYLIRGGALPILLPLELFARYKAVNVRAFCGVSLYIIVFILVLYYIGKWIIKEKDISF